MYVAPVLINNNINYQTGLLHSVCKSIILHNDMQDSVILCKYQINATVT